jgi:hypothetical protein
MPDVHPSGASQLGPNWLGVSWAIVKFFLLPLAAFALLGTFAAHQGWTETARVIPSPLFNGVVEALEGRRP